MVDKILYSCKKCFKTFDHEVKKCPSCGGEIKQTLTEEFIKEKKPDYQCPHCNYFAPYEFDICPHCGKRSKRCPHCGYVLYKKFWICPRCGKKI